MKLVLQILLPILVLVAALAAAWKLVAAVTPPPRKPPAVLAPLVRTALVQSGPVRIDVQAQGTVEPRGTVDLALQVGGRVVMVADALRAGGFFAADQVLLRIDDADYRLQIAGREADVARAELRLAQEKAEAEAAVAAWRRLEGDRAADPLVTRAPQLAEAERSLQAARAALERAQLDLERTALRLPFAGRVRSGTVTAGQLVMPGQTLAQVYPTDAVEVRLPVPDRDLQFLDLPQPTGGDGAPTGPAVTLRAEFAGQVHEWPATIDRSEGEIDRRTRQLTLVARVRDPFATAPDRQRPPLAVGLFVQARITGRTFDGMVALPREALRADGTVMVLDAENRLRTARIEVLRQEQDRVLVRSGLRDGQRVCLTALDTATDGMMVRLADEPAPEAGK